MTAKTAPSLVRLYRYPVRVCRWMHECCLCHQNITAGQRYYDGGYGRRAHVECPKQAAAPEVCPNCDGRGMVPAFPGAVIEQRPCSCDSKWQPDPLPATNEENLRARAAGIADRCRRSLELPPGWHAVVIVTDPEGDFVGVSGTASPEYVDAMVRSAVGQHPRNAPDGSDRVDHPSTVETEGLECITPPELPARED